MIELTYENIYVFFIIILFFNCREEDMSNLKVVATTKCLSKPP